MKTLAHQTLRWLFIALLVATAVAKLLDNRGMASVIETYQFGLGEPVRLWLGMSVALAELALAWTLAMGRRPQFASAAVAILYAGYTVLSVSLVLRGLPVENDGWFGVFWARPAVWSSVGINLATTALGAVLYSSRPQFDRLGMAIRHVVSSYDRDAA